MHEEWYVARWMLLASGGARGQKNIDVPSVAPVHGVDGSFIWGRSVNPCLEPKELEARQDNVELLFARQLEEHHKATRRA